MSNLAGLAYRILFGAAFALAALAAVEKVANFVGYTILGTSYPPSRMLELAVVALLFVIALLLRDLREAARKSA